MPLHVRIEWLVPSVVRLLAHALSVSSWGLFWFAVIAAACILVQREGWKNTGVAVSVMAAMFAAYVAVYVSVTPADFMQFVNTSADRLLMHLAGPAVYVIGVTTGKTTARAASG